MENQNGISEKTLMASINAMRMGYQRKPPAPSAPAAPPPYTEREIRDIFFIRDGLDWLMAEAKAGYPVTEKMHGRLICDIVARRQALEEKERRGFDQKAGGETREDHTTSHYTWRTQHDGRVRPEHAANDGKVFAWDDPPPTGNPGEAFGCRCWAEPYEAEDGELQERSSQVVTFAMPDATPAWTRDDFFDHYYHGGGRPVLLSDIGHLQNIITSAFFCLGRSLVVGACRTEFSASLTLKPSPVSSARTQSFPWSSPACRPGCRWCSACA